MSWFHASIVGLVAMVAVSAVIAIVVVGSTNVTVTNTITEVEGPVHQTPFKVKSMEMVFECPALIQCCSVQLDDVLLDLDSLTISCGEAQPGANAPNCQCKEVEQTDLPVPEPEA